MKQKYKKVDFLVCCSVNMLADKGVIRAGEEAIVTNQGRGVIRAG